MLRVRLNIWTEDNYVTLMNFLDEMSIINDYEVIDYEYDDEVEDGNNEEF